MKFKFKNYRVRYTWCYNYGHPRHSYEVIGRHGAVHLHITDMDEYALESNTERYSAGLETHWRQPPDHMCEKPPSQDECWLLKQPCWHDGTSLYANEKFVPLFASGLSPCEMLYEICLEADRIFSNKYGADKPLVEIPGADVLHA